MERHYERERKLQSRLEAVLGSAMPEVEVVDVELDEPHDTVRIFVDRPGGVMLDTCAQVTAAVRDVCPDHVLEVSSPGIERPLRAPEHFRAAVGRRVRLRRAGAKRPYRFQIVAVDDEAGVTLAPQTGEERIVPFDEIVRCRLIVDVPVPGTARAVNGKGRS